MHAFVKDAAPPRTVRHPVPQAGVDLRRVEEDAEVPEPRADALPARVEEVLRDAHRPRVQAGPPAVRARGAGHAGEEQLGRRHGGRVGLGVADDEQGLHAARHEQRGRVEQEVALQAVVQVVQRGVQPAQVLHAQVQPGLELVLQAGALLHPQGEDPGPLERRVDEQELVGGHRVHEQAPDFLRRVRGHVLEHGLGRGRGAQGLQRGPQEGLEAVGALEVEEAVAGRVEPDVDELQRERGEVRAEELPALRDARGPADAVGREGVDALRGAPKHVLQDGLLERLHLLAQGRVGSGGGDCRCCCCCCC